MPRRHTASAQVIAKMSPAEYLAEKTIRAENYQMAFNNEKKVREETNRSIAQLRRAERACKDAAEDYAELHQFSLAFPDAPWNIPQPDSLPSVTGAAEKD